jgi:hypothetical protein
MVEHRPVHVTPEVKYSINQIFEAELNVDYIIFFPGRGVHSRGLALLFPQSIRLILSA